MKRCTTGIGLLIAALFAWGFTSPQEQVITGRTMGTTYSIRVISDRLSESAVFKDAVDARLEAINQSMSTYIKDSEISRFNRLRDTTTRFEVSEDLWNVMKVAQRLYRLTQGAWDGTVNPLVDLWGFGSRGSKRTLPPRHDIDRVLKEIGFKYIKIGKKAPYLKKGIPNVTLDLSSIAKGYGVDQVAHLIRRRGYKDFLVEIGGEVYVSGRRKDGTSWRIGINQPVPSAPLNQVYRVISLQDKAMATSGDYRNFFVKDGVRYSHIMDPRTGYPVRNGVVSASVTADTCTFADGLATVLVVLGPEKAISLVERLAAVECFLVSQQQDGVFIDRASTGFPIVQ
jgi:thiamine biosynthesis lipoprotein